MHTRYIMVCLSTNDHHWDLIEYGKASHFESALLFTPHEEKSLVHTANGKQTKIYFSCMKFANPGEFVFESDDINEAEKIIRHWLFINS